MPAPWETSEMREWAEKFLAEERTAGRTYCMVATNRQPVPGGSVTNFSLISSEPQVSVDEFRQLITEFMERHEWDRDGGIEPWVETMEMAVMVYVRDVVQVA